MALIEFELLPLQEIQPWGEKPNRTLNWFALTDGNYHINVGSEQLFRYSPEIMEDWHKNDPISKNLTIYSDYQVARLWEDILDLLPNILQPIPAEVSHYIVTAEAEQKWQNRIDKYYEKAKADEQFVLYESAAFWWGARRLPTEHLATGPKIWFWRIENQVFIRWNNQEKTISQIPVWSSPQGEISLSVEKFLHEVQDFNDRLILAMAKRIEAIKEKNIFPSDVKVHDLDLDHQSRQEWLNNRLQYPPNYDDWGNIYEANQKIFKLQP